MFDTFYGRIALLVDNGTDEKLVAEWLKRERFKPSLIYSTKDWSVDGSTPRADAVWSISAELGRVEWYLDVDTETIAVVLAKGIPSLLVAVPHVTRPEWRSAKSIRGWGDIADELDKQAVLRSERSWGDVE